MKKPQAILIAFVLMLVGSVGGIMAWDLLMQSSRAQGGFGDFPWDDEFSERERAERRGVRQVWCEAVFIQIDTADLDEIRAEENALITLTGEKAILTAAEKQELLRQLREKPSFEYIGTASLITISGQQALMQMVEEVRYPLSADIGLPEEAESNAEEPVACTRCFGPYGDFETREVGIRLNVTPTISADLKIVTLVLLPEASFFGGWRQAGGAAEDQPLLRSWDVTTTLYCPDGMTFVMTGAPTKAFADAVAAAPGAAPEKSARKSAVILISAKILHEPGDTDEATTE